MSVVKKCFKLLKLHQHFDTGLPEREVISYLKSWNNKLQQDEYGNLYLINPGKPLINAHMDTVQSADCVKKLKTLRLKDWTIKAKDAIIWGDDKCWIALAMEIYEKLWNEVSLLFTRQEETGTNWAREFCDKHKDLVSECKYCLTLDRRWGWDIIWYNNSYCSKEFENEVARLSKEFWYKPTTWLSSDANHLSKIINCVNLSVGYYNPHTKNEYIKCDELVNTLECVLYILKNLTTDYPIYTAPKFDWWKDNYTYKKSNYNYNKNYNYNYNRYNWPADEEDDDYDNYGSWWNYYKSYYKSKNKWAKLSDFFEYSNWVLVVKQDMFLTNVKDADDWIELAEGKYDLCLF